MDTHSTGTAGQETAPPGRPRPSDHPEVLVDRIGFPGYQVKRLPVDAHVHFHRDSLVEPTLDAAANNFARACRSTGSLLGILLLVQSSREQVFEQLLEGQTCGRWRLGKVAAEPQTLIARRNERQIAIVCGRQVRCERGLEVLALGTTTRFPDGRSLHEMIERVRGDGALVALPWGFGKWIGRAGEIVREALRRHSPDELFAGDNGGRLSALGMPGLLRDASQAGFRILPGTDPFPFGGDYRRVGAFGFLAGVDPEPAGPWASLQQWLRTSESMPQPYGRALGPRRFLLNQGWIQVRNRLSRRVAG